MICRSCAEAGGTQRSPLLPSARLPSEAKNSSAAFRLCREVECPQPASCSRISLRLIGSPFARRAARMSSIVLKVGFAPGLENSSDGARIASAMGYTNTCTPHIRTPLLGQQGAGTWSSESDPPTLAVSGTAGRLRLLVHKGASSTSLGKRECGVSGRPGPFRPPYDRPPGRSRGTEPSTGGTEDPQGPPPPG